MDLTGPYSSNSRRSLFSVASKLMRPTNSVLKGSPCSAPGPLSGQEYYHSIRVVQGGLSFSSNHAACRIGSLSISSQQPANRVGSLRVKKAPGRHTSILSSLLGSQSFTPSSICSFAFAIFCVARRIFLHMKCIAGVKDQFSSSSMQPARLWVDEGKRPLGDADKAHTVVSGTAREAPSLWNSTTCWRSKQSTLLAKMQPAHANIDDAADTRSKCCKHFAASRVLNS